MQMHQAETGGDSRQTLRCLVFGCPIAATMALPKGMDFKAC